MKLKSKLLLGAMTPMERARGRYMRAPDHPTGGDNGGSSGADGQGTGNAGDADAGLTTAQKLEKEFGQEITPATDDDSDDSSGQGESGAEDDDDGDADNAGDEGSEADADEGGAEGDSEAGEEGEAEAGKPKPKNPRVQQRIDELTADARFNEREAAKWKQRAEELGYNASADGGGTEVPEEPDASKYQYGENDLDYIRDRAKFDAKVEVLTEQAQARFKSETAALEAKWSTTLAANESRYPDFQEVVVKGAENWHCPPVIAVGIKDSEHGVDIAYKLAKDPAEAERISKLSPLEQARVFGHMERDFAGNARIAELEAKVAKLEGKGGQADGKPTPRIVSKAPEPPRRRVSGGGGISETPADTDDFAAFDRMADAKLGIKS